MKVPDPESLRQEYNRNYQQPVDRWSCHDDEKAASIVALVMKHLRALGHMTTGRMLDVGCAKGHICEAFRRQGFEAHGLDYSEVAIAQARGIFPRCEFHHVDGFNPRFELRFDLIFMRGFSGCNTMDLRAVADLCNKYVALLNPLGLLVLAFSTDFSGQHRAGDTVCWSQRQLDQLAEMVAAAPSGRVLVPRPTILKQFKVALAPLFRRRSKYYFYLFFRASDPASTLAE